MYNLRQKVENLGKKDYDVSRFLGMCQIFYENLI